MMSMEINKKKMEKLELFYFQITDLWKQLCEEHSRLFDLTGDEYSVLLASNLDELDVIVEKKMQLTTKINHLESVRLDVMNRLNEAIHSGEVAGETEVKSVADLLRIMADFEKINNQNHLFRFNRILIDIIEKIKEQNKKNQMFINKALLSLRQIREDVTGTKSYTTYNARGIPKQEKEVGKNHKQ